MIPGEKVEGVCGNAKMLINYGLCFNTLGDNCGLMELFRVHIYFPNSNPFDKGGKRATYVEHMKAFEEAVNRLVTQLSHSVGGKTLVFSDNATLSGFSEGRINDYEFDMFEGRARPLWIPEIYSKENPRDLTREEKENVLRIRKFRTRDVFYLAKKREIGIMSCTSTFTNPNHTSEPDNQIRVYTWQPNPPDMEPNDDDLDEAGQFSKFDPEPQTHIFVDTEELMYHE